MITFNTDAVYTGLTLEGLAGDDNFSITPLQDVDITAQGMDPTGSDHVVINASGATSVRDLTADGATVGNVTLQTIESLLIAGADGLTVETSGDATVVHTPGASDDAGRVQVDALLAVDYVNATGLTVDGAAGDVELIVDGTDASDTFAVTAGAAVELNGRIDINTNSVEAIALRGLGGGDTFNIAAVSGITIDVEGDEPGSGSDVLNYTSTGSAALDLGRSTIEESLGTDVLTYAGIEQLNFYHGGNALTVQGSDLDDDFVVTPLDSDYSTLQRNGVSPVVNADGAGAFTIDALDGNDSVTVRGSAGNDTFTATDSLVTITGRLPIALSHHEAITLEGQAGSDDFYVTPSATVPFTVLGGDPIGASDQLHLNIGAGTVTVNPGPESDSGNLLVTGNLPISFDEIEGGTITGTPGSTVNINGTDADNDITIIGTGPNAFTASVDGGPAFSFSGITNLNVDGLAGDDDITVNIEDAGWGVALRVDGGLPTAGSDQLRVTGIDGGAADTVTWTASDEDSGSLTMFAGATTITVDGIETLTYDGESDNDAVQVNGAGQFVHTPGAAFDAGRMDLKSGGVTLLGINYENLGVGNVTANGSIVSNDTLVVLGTDGKDVLNIGFSGADAAVFDLHADVIQHVLLLTSNVEYYFVNTGDDDDIINVEAAVLADSLEISGGDGAGVDIVQFLGEAAAQDVEVRPGTAYNTDQEIDLDGNSTAVVTTHNVSLLNFFDEDGGDTLTVDPGVGNSDMRVAAGTDSNTDLVTSNILPNIQFTGFDTFTVDGTSAGAATATFVTHQLSGAASYELDGEPSDTLVIEGREGADDSYVLTAPVSGDVAVGSADPTVTGSGIGRVRVNTLDGDDLVTVNVGAADLVRVPITFDGGAGTDDLLVLGSPATTVNTVVYNVGPVVDRGRLDYVTGSGTEMVIDFMGLEPVHDYVPANLTVYGNHADNAINYTVGPNSVPPKVAGPLNPGGVVTGMISVDAFEIIEFGNKTDVTIDGRAGDDDVNVSDPTRPGASGNLTIIGDDPTASDAVVINGTTGQDTVMITITGPHSATLSFDGGVTTTNVNTTEGLIYNGNGGADNVTIFGISSGTNQFVYTPGAVPDSASFTGFHSGGSGVAFLPVDLLELGNGTITVDGSTASATTLVVHGKNTNDVIGVDSSGTIAVTTLAGVHNPISTADVADLVVDGLDGDDRFTVVGNHPFTSVAIAGNNPSASDVLNFNGSGGAVDVDYAASTVTEGIWGAVSYTGIEALNVNAGAANLTIFGTTDDDHFDVTPEATVTTTRLLDNNTTVHATNVGVFTIDADSGDDTLTVNASAVGNTIGVTGSDVTITGAAEAVNYLDVEALNVLGSTGSDVFNVTPDPDVAMFINGGDPIGGSDTLNVNFATGTLTFYPGPESDEGSYVLDPDGPLGPTDPYPAVSFDHIEGGTITGAAGTAVVITGTNADNDITVVGKGTDDFTVSVDGGPAFLFLDVPNLTIDGLAGDDDIDIDVNNLQLVLFSVEGGMPTAEVDTVTVSGGGPLNTASWTPSGVEGGTLVVESQTIQLTGMEQLIYDGEDENETLTVNGGTGNADDRFTHTPGAAGDEGTIGIVDIGNDYSALGISYVNLGLQGAVNFDGGGGDNILVAFGTSSNDTFDLTATTGVISLQSNVGNSANSEHVDLVPTDIRMLIVDSLDGDDTFNVEGAQPYTNIRLEGGDPSASDVANLTGDNASAITFNTGTATQTVYGGGLGTVTNPLTLVGIEEVNLDAVDQDITVNGTPTPNVFHVTPTGEDTAQILVDGVNQVLNTDNDGLLTIAENTAGDGDTVNVYGNSNDNAIDVTRGATTTVVVSNLLPLKQIDILSSNVEALTVNAGLGDDEITVSGTAGSPLTVDGGMPTASDTLIVQLATAGGSATTVVPGATPDSGVVEDAQDGNVDFVGIEYLEIEGAALTDDLVVQGTNGNDSIALAYLDSDNRVWVNDRAVVSFEDFDEITLDARFGDDKISVSPVDLDGVDTVYVEGGDPTASDELVVNGRDGNDQITFTPTSPMKGRLRSSALRILSSARPNRSSSTASPVTTMTP